MNKEALIEEIGDFPTIDQAKKLVPLCQKILLIYVLRDWASIGTWIKPGRNGPEEFFLKKCRGCGWVIDGLHTNGSPRCHCYYNKQEG